MKAISNFLQVCVNIVVLAVISTAVYFTFMDPPPSSAPTMSTVEWKEDAPASTKALAVPVFAMANWEVRTAGPVSFAKARVPLSNDELHFVGVGGRWYGNN